MKIGITSEGNTLDAQIDSRFGRCAFFAIYDTDTKQTSFLVNPGKDASEAAGSVAVQFIAKQGVNKIIAGEFGGKALPLLEALKIEMQTEKGKTIAQIISGF